MLAHLLQPWLSSKTALAKRLVFAGVCSAKRVDTAFSLCTAAVGQLSVCLSGGIVLSRSR